MHAAECGVTESLTNCYYQQDHNQTETKTHSTSTAIAR